MLNGRNKWPKIKTFCYFISSSCHIFHMLIVIYITEPGFHHGGSGLEPEELLELMDTTVYATYMTL